MTVQELTEEIMYRFADSGGNFVNEPVMGKVYETLRSQQAELMESKIHERRGWQHAEEIDQARRNLQAEIEVVKTLYYNKGHDDGRNLVANEKPLHLSLQKTEDGELVAVTFTNDDHQIVEVLWMKENRNV